MYPHIKYRLHLLLLLLFISISTSSYTQQLVYRNAPTKGIELKWYTQQFMYKNGVNIFRKEDGKEWVKLNEAPLKKGSYTPSATQMANDSTLASMVDILSGGQHIQLEGVILLNVLVQSFQNNDFANFLGIYYHDKTVQEGISYTYKIEDAFTKKTIVEQEGITLTSNTSFSPPQQLAFKKKGRVVSLSWLPETNRYFAVNVYRKAPNETTFQKVNELPAIISESAIDTVKKDFYEHYQETIPKISGTFEYKLKALSFFAEESDYSETLTVVHKQVNPAPTPSFFRVDSTKGTEIHLAWNHLDDERIKGFKIYTCETNNGIYTLLNNQILSPQATHIHFSVDRPGDHFFKLAVLNSQGDENLSDYALAVVEDMFAPEMIEIVKAQADSMNITVSWNTSMAKDLLGYQIFRSVTPEDTASFVLMNATPIQDTFYIDALSKRLKTAMSYRVVAVDSAFNKSYFSVPATAKLIDVVPPSAPHFKNITCLPSGALKIEWIANREPDFNTYKLYRYHGDSRPKIVRTTNTQFVDSSVLASTTYSYRLSAVDVDSNESALSKPFRIKTPERIIKEEANIELTIKAKKKKTKLKWKFITPISVDMVKGFMVYEITSSGTSKAITVLLQKKKYTVKSPGSFSVKGYGVDGQVWTTKRF